MGARRRGRRMAATGALLLVLLAVAGGLAPAIAPSDPYATILDQRLHPPGAGHPFGQDTLGRHVLARMLHGALISLAAGTATVTLSLFVGVLLGATAGHAGRWGVEARARGGGVLLCLPAPPLALPP